MDYKCPNCQQVYAGMLRYCPYCGTTIKYNQYDYMAIDNYSDSKKSRNLLIDNPSKTYKSEIAFS